MRREKGVLFAGEWNEDRLELRIEVRRGITEKGKNYTVINICHSLNMFTHSKLYI